MEIIQSNVPPNIFQLEKKLREVICRLQGVTESFEKLQQDDLQLQQELSSKDSLLEDERKTSSELRFRLKLATERINRLEEEKLRERIELSQLAMDRESGIKERDSLAKEFAQGQSIIAKLKIENEALQNVLRQVTRRKEQLEDSLLELNRDYERITANVDVCIAKLTREQRHLFENCKTIVLLNKRLHAACTSFHATNEKDKTEIQNLRCKLIAASIDDSRSSEEKLHPETEILRFKMNEMLTELRSELKNSEEVQVYLDKIIKVLSSENENQGASDHR